MHRRPPGYLRIVKEVKYGHNDRIKLEKIEKGLSQLSKDKDTFQFIKIPDFSYEIENNIVTVEHEFIRGETLTALLQFGHYDDVKRYGKLIYKDFVLRENKRTFADYSLHNYVECEFTKELYIIDLEHYRHHELDKRKKRFFEIYGAFAPNYDWAGYK